MLRRYVLVTLPLFLMGAQAEPPAPWAEARGDLDGDGSAEKARLLRDGVLVVEAADGRELVRVKLPDPGRIERASVRIVPVEDRVALHARAELGRGQAAEAVVSGGKALFVGRTGPIGDGDRAERLRVDEAGIVRYQTSPGVTRCDGEEQLFPERWDFASRRFRAVSVDPPQGRPLKTSATGPAGLDGPPLGLFHFVAASTDASGQRRADMLAVPRELEDNAAATQWQAGAGASARGAWVTARAQAGAQRLRAVQIVGGSQAPRAVTLVLGPGSDEQFTVEIGPGTRWVSLPDAPPTACVSLVVAEPGARENGLAEVGLYTDVDGPGGLERLVDDVAQSRADADGAAHLLMTRGAVAAPAVAAALPAAVEPGRRRLLQVLTAIATPATAPSLGRALETAAALDRAPLVDALARLGDAGASEAARILGDKGQTAEARADAATVLGRVPGAASQAALLAAAGHGEPMVRAATMGGLAHQYAAAPQPVLAALAAAAGRDDAATGDLARAIGTAAHGSADAAAALVGAWERVAAAPERFEARLRLVRALGDVGTAAALPALRTAARDGDPEVRAAALTAAATLGGGDVLVRAATGDGDAGVRQAAWAALGGRGDGAAAERALAGDGWPMVRHAAADALGAACSEGHGRALGALGRAVNGAGKAMSGADPSEEVRRAALAALGHCDAPMETLTAALGERRQPISVRELAAALVAKRGGPGAAPALAAALDDVLSDPAADERAASLAAVCARALGHTGDRSRPVLEALGEAANEPTSPHVRAAAMESIGLLCPDGAQTALHKGERDNDRSVARAAQVALGRCHK